MRGFAGARVQEADESGARAEGEQPAAAVRLPGPYLVWVTSLWLLQLGDAALFFSLGWAATGYGAAAAGGVLAAIVLPRTLLLLLGGVIGDRIGPRSIMMFCNALMGVASALIALVAWRGGVSLPLLYCAAVVSGVTGAFYVPSAGSYARSLVEDSLVSRAVALRQSGTQLTNIIGGPVGGLLVAVSGLQVAAAINAATCLVAFGVLVRVRPRKEAAAPPLGGPHVARAALDGLALAARNSNLRVALILVAVGSAFIMPVGSMLLPLLARENGWSASGTGLIIGAQSLGTIAVTLVLSRTGALGRAGVAAAAGMATTGAGVLGIAWSPSTGAAMAAALICGAGTGLLIGHLSPVLITATPMTHLARIQSIASLVQSGSLFLTTGIIGVIAASAGPRGAVVVCAVVLCLAAAASMANRTVREVRGRVDTPAAAAGSPARRDTSPS